SEHLRQAGGLDRVDAALARYLAAEPRRREHLAGVAAPVGVEGAAQELHHVEVVGAELLGQVLLLVRADAVLAGDRTAEVEAGGKGVGRRRLAPPPAPPH